MPKRILISLSIIGVVAAIATGGVLAVLPGTATISGNTLSTGNADLKIKVPDTNCNVWSDFCPGKNWTGLYPGWHNSYNIYLKNASASPIALKIIPFVLKLDILPDFLETGSSQALWNNTYMEISWQDGSHSTGRRSLRDWADNTTIQLEPILNQGQEFGPWLVKFDIPGSVGNEIANSHISFNLVFNAFQTDGGTSGHMLSVAKAGNGYGVVTSVPAGINCGNACSASFIAGTVVRLFATAGTGSTFTGWSGACSGTGICTVTMNEARNVTAIFTANTYTLTVSKTGTGGGTVTSNPSGINCGAICSANYDYGTNVNLTAIPDANSIFTGWSGACSGTGVCTVTMVVARNVIANFASHINTHTYTLTVSKTGTGLGTVTSNPAIINCGPTCTAYFLDGTVVTLFASPNPGSIFTGWSGACSGTGNCSLTMNDSKNVTANFVAIAYTLAVYRSGNGFGTITSFPAGINCGGLCSASFAKDTLVTLTATPGPTSIFTGWSGACTGTGACIVLMNNTKSVIASFTQVTFNLTVSRTGTGYGVVTSAPSGINCGATCSANFNANSTVSLFALAGNDSVFTGWSGACTGTGWCSFMMNGAKSVSANFNRR